MKKLVLVFALMFSLSFFCGCSGETMDFPKQYIFSGIENGSDGKIIQQLSFAVDSALIGKVASSQKEELEFKRKLIDGVGALRTQFLLNFALIYLNAPQEDCKIGDGVKLTPARYVEKTDCVSFEIIFTVKAWNFYHSSPSDDSCEKKDSLFIKKVTSEGPFPFSLPDNNGKTVAENYKSVYLKAGEGLSFKDEIADKYNPSFVYLYSTESHKIKTNAEITFENNGKYRHVWIKNYDQIDGSKINLYYYKINPPMWIACAVILPSLALIIYLVIIKVKK